MDKEEAILRHLIKTEIGNLVSHELEIRFKPLQSQMNQMQESNDHISEQIKEDRQDINQIKIDIAKSLTQNKVIIENQNTQEDKVVEAVENATQDIKPTVKKSVEDMFEKKPFLRKIKDTFGIK